MYLSHAPSRSRVGRAHAARRDWDRRTCQARIGSRRTSQVLGNGLFTHRTFSTLRGCPRQFEDVSVRGHRRHVENDAIFDARIDQVARTGLPEHRQAKPTHERGTISRTAPINVPHQWRTGSRGRSRVESRHVRSRLDRGDRTSPMRTAMPMLRTLWARFFSSSPPRSRSCRSCDVLHGGRRRNGSPYHGMAKLNPIRTSLTFCSAMSASRTATSRESFSRTLQIMPTSPE